MDNRTIFTPGYIYSRQELLERIQHNNRMINHCRQVNAAQEGKRAALREEIGNVQLAINFGLNEIARLERENQEIRRNLAVDLED